MALLHHSTGTRIEEARPPLPGSSWITVWVFLTGGSGGLFRIQCQALFIQRSSWGAYLYLGEGQDFFWGAQCRAYFYLGALFWAFFILLSIFHSGAQCVTYFYFSVQILFRGYYMWHLFWEAQCGGCAAKVRSWCYLCSKIYMPQRSTIAKSAEHVVNRLHIIMVQNVSI